MCWLSIHFLYATSSTLITAAFLSIISADMVHLDRNHLNSYHVDWCLFACDDCCQKSKSNAIILMMKFSCSSTEGGPEWPSWTHKLSKSIDFTVMISSCLMIDHGHCALISIISILFLKKKTHRFVNVFNRDYIEQPQFKTYPIIVGLFDVITAFSPIRGVYCMLGSLKFI